MRFSLLKSFVAVVFFSLIVSSAFANSAEISLNSNTFKLQGDFELGNNGVVIEASALHNQDRGNVAGLAGLKYGNAGSEGLNAGLGLKLAYVDPDIEPEVTILPFPLPEFSSPSGAALAIGGKVTYIPPQYNRMNISAHIWYAPDVLAFDKIDKYQEIGVSVGYNVIRDADVFIGYRNLKAGFKEFGDGTLDTGLHAGIRVKF